jgi:hypothetical protein
MDEGVAGAAEVAATCVKHAKPSWEQGVGEQHKTNGTTPPSMAKGGQSVVVLRPEGVQHVTEWHSGTDARASRWRPVIARPTFIALGDDARVDVVFCV